MNPHAHTQLADLYDRKLFGVGAKAILKAAQGQNHPLAGCFCCVHRHDCQVRTDDPIYVGSFGSPDSDILVLGEAPSTSDLRNDQGKQPVPCIKPCPDGTDYVHAHLPGSTSAMPPKGNQYAFIDFIRNECLSPGKKPGPWPYFTDVVKCGLNPKTQRSKEKIIHKLRAPHCIDHLLVDQIHIIQPRIIACVGAFAYETVIALIKSGKIPHIAVRCFLHYSGRAQAPTTIKDKRNVIWPIQACCVESENLCATLSDLSWIKAAGKNCKGQGAESN